MYFSRWRCGSNWTNVVEAVRSPTIRHQIWKKSGRVISSSQRQLPTQHTTNTTDKHPCQQWGSNPRSQQFSGPRPQGHRDRLPLLIATLIHPIFFTFLSTKSTDFLPFVAHHLWWHSYNCLRLSQFLGHCLSGAWHRALWKTGTEFWKICGTHLFLPWRQRHQIPLEYWYPPPRLRDVTYHMAVLEDIRMGLKDSGQEMCTLPQRKDQRRVM
jgi:hypothetical protein